MKLENKSANFYDKYLPKQVSIGLNLRHLVILTKLKKLGVKKNHTVLEFGCGIGIISGKLSKYISKGKIIGIDISPESIKYANAKYKHRKNISFICEDILEYNTSDLFDLIILPDVLEHIPMDKHRDIIFKIKSISKDNTIVFVSIPSARYLEYMHQNNDPELQIIDQPIEANVIVRNFEEAGFELQEFRLVSLFVNLHDYRHLVFKVKTTATSVKKKTKLRIIFNKAIARIHYHLKYFFL